MVPSLLPCDDRAKALQPT